VVFTLSSHSSRAHRSLHSFPTRRSSDLETAAGEIVEALALLNRLDGIEILILGRGGGSAEDLGAFNHERVADAIFQSRIPVVSRSEEHTSELQSPYDLVCRLLLEKKKKK